MAAIKEKVEALYKELEATVDQHNQALQILNTTKEKAISLQGAINALRELEEAGISETTTEAE